MRIFHSRSINPGSPHIMLATPSYSGAVSPGHTHALVQSIELLRYQGIAVDHLLMAENCHVDDARNAIVREFLLTDCSKLVFLDADVGWRPDDLLKLVRFDESIVAGVYPKRADGQLEYPVYCLPGDRQANDGGLVEVLGAPTGFMSIKREVLQDLCNLNMHRRFKTSGMTAEDAPYTILFERTLEEGQRWSGDYAFCRAWRKQGGKIFVCPEMRFAHEGSKEWVGSLGDYWRQEAGLEDPQLSASIKELRAGKISAMNFAQLYNAYGSNFAAPPAQLAVIYDIAKSGTAPILETGSGLSTLVLGIAAEQSGAVVHSLEHDRGFYENTKRLLEAHGVSGVKLHYAPLREYNDFVWYEVPDGLVDDPFGFVLVDGPQRQHGRAGLFQLLHPFLTKAVVLMDDTDDPEILDLTKRFCAAQGRQFEVHGADHGFAICLPPRGLPIAA